MSITNNLLVWEKDFVFFEEGRDGNFTSSTISLNIFQRIWRVLGGYSHTHLEKAASVAQAAAFTGKISTAYSSNKAHALMAKAAQHNKLRNTYLGEHEISHKVETTPFKVTCKGRFVNLDLCAIKVKIVMPNHTTYKATLSFNLLDTSDIRMNFTIPKDQPALNTLFHVEEIGYFRFYSSIFAIASKILLSDKQAKTKVEFTSYTDRLTEIAKEHGFHFLNNGYEPSNSYEPLVATRNQSNAIYFTSWSLAKRT